LQRTVEDATQETDSAGVAPVLPEMEDSEISNMLAPSKETEIDAVPGELPL